MRMPKQPENYWDYAQIGLELAASVLLGFWAGYQLDKKLGTSPWLMLGCTAVGMATGFYVVARELFKDGKPPAGGKA